MLQVMKAGIQESESQQVVDKKEEEKSLPFHVVFFRSVNL